MAGMVYMNFKVDKKREMPDIGTVYLLELDVDGKRVLKIGITTRKVEDRVVEILTSYWHQYREFPYCRPKRFRKTTDYFEKEQMLLKYFEKCKYESEKKFGGCQELIDVPLETVVDMYERVLTGEILDKKDRYEPEELENRDEGAGISRKAESGEGDAEVCAVCGAAITEMVVSSGGMERNNDEKVENAERCGEIK